MITFLFACSFDIRVMQQGRMKGQAFIGMPSEVLALQAVQETNGFILHGKPMVVVSETFVQSVKNCCYIFVCFYSAIC